MSREYPDHLGELSTGALEDAMNELEAWLRGIDRNYQSAVHGSPGGGGYSISIPAVPENIWKCMKVIRLVTGMPRRSPWYGIVIDHEDSSVDVGVMMRNAFEAVGDWVDHQGMANMKDGKQYKNTHWFTRLYLPRFRAGKREYNAWLDNLRELDITDANPGSEQVDKGQQ